jgi:hypothetical protein
LDVCYRLEFRGLLDGPPASAQVGPAWARGSGVKIRAGPLPEAGGVHPLILLEWTRIEIIALG